LDLSDNRLTSLNDGTFAGLHLHQLFLNGNKRLVLNSGHPFANLTVFGLYLHDCRLTRVDLDILAPLDGSLRVLWLSENRLHRLDPALSRLFASLNHFRVADNRLHCNCELFWLWRLYDEQRRRTNINLMLEESPECSSPAWLRGRHFDEVSEADLRCRAPTLADVEVTLTDGDDDDVSQSSAHRRLVLRCTAIGDPTPNVHWIRAPPTTDELLLPTSMTQDAVDDMAEALLVLNGDDVQSASPDSRAFTCVANNIVGNVTVTVRRIPQAWKVAAGSEQDDGVAPRYTYVSSGMAEVTGMDERRVIIQRSRFSSDLTTRSTGGSVDACSVLSENGTDSSQLSWSRELCGGRDRRLRASSTLDRRGVQSSAESHDRRQYAVKHLVVAVLLTVLLTATTVVAVVAICLRHRCRSNSTAVPPHQRPITDNAAQLTASATAPVYDTVAHLTRKSLS